MARYRGTFTVAANYEPLTASPLDARELVETKSDLTNPLIWQQENGDIWTYVGMKVVVTSDENADNNGLYILTHDNYTLESSWQKQADIREIELLKEQIENIEISGGGTVSIEVDTMEDLPKVGQSDTTYYVKENSSIQRWDDETKSYHSFGSSGDTPVLDINIIHGGNAHGTN